MPLSVRFTAIRGCKMPYPWVTTFRLGSILGRFMGWSMVPIMRLAALIFKVVSLSRVRMNLVPRRASRSPASSCNPLGTERKNRASSSSAPRFRSQPM